LTALLAWRRRLVDGDLFVEVDAFGLLDVVVMPAVHNEHGHANLAASSR
jgi:hypothetical protein